MDDSTDSFDCVNDHEMVDISTVQQQVKYMRRRKAEKQAESTVVSLHDKTDDDTFLSSGSNYQLSGDDDVLQIRKKGRGSSSEDDDDMPLINLATIPRVNVTSSEEPCSSFAPIATAQQPTEQNASMSIIDSSEQVGALEHEDNLDPASISSDGEVASSVGEADSPTSSRGRGRKRLSNRNRKLQKYRKEKGLSFLDRAGVQRDSKAMRLGCGMGCRKKCHNTLKECDREAIFHNFWQFGDTTAQRLFVVRCVEKKSPGRTYVKQIQSRRQQTIVYSFTKDGSTHSVCKKFFLDTLAIKEDFVYSSLKCYSGNSKDDEISEKRGKHGHQSRKLPARTMAFIKKHIGSFHPVESHYRRKNSTRMYLPENLSLQQMFRLYCQECDNNEEPKASSSVYKRVFYNDFNLAFYKPKKDQCDLCLAIKNNPSTIDETAMLEHLTQKQLAREVKERFKAMASQDPFTSAACFDLQKVLECPRGPASSFYYSRKLEQPHYFRDGHRRWILLHVAGTPCEKGSKRDQQLCLQFSL